MPIDDLDQYRNPRDALSRGLQVTEIPAERRLNRSGPSITEPRVGAAVTPTARLQPSAIGGLDVADLGPREAGGVRNPNVGAAGSPEAQAFRSGGSGANATAQGKLPPTRAARFAAAAKRVAANPLVRGAGVAGLPLTAGAQAIDTLNTPTEDYYQRTGIEPEATVVPQLVKDIGVRALGTAQDIGNKLTFGLADRAGNALAGNGFVRSPQYQDQPQRLATGPIGTAAAQTLPRRPPPLDIAEPPPYSNEGRSSSAIDDQQDPRRLQTTSAPVSRAPGERSAIDIERAALDIGRQNSALRQQADAYGPGARNPDGSGGAAFIGSDIERKNAETTAAGLRFDARLRGGRQGDELLRQAQDAENQPRAEELARAGLANQRDIAALRERGELSQRQLADATTRRGQDLGIAEGAQRTAGALAVERERGKSARDIAELGADARLGAAEAAARRYTVIPGGQEVREVNGLPVTVTVPARVLDNATGKLVDQGEGASSAGPKTLASDPRAIAIRDDKSLSIEQKRAKLKELGY